jgi:hypothetical protein
MKSLKSNWWLVYTLALLVCCCTAAQADWTIPVTSQMPSLAVTGVGKQALSDCRELAFSTEEDFITRGPEPPDGNPVISDGDLLGLGCAVCARNNDLLEAFDLTADLGLDAADVIDVNSYIVAFSTELDSTNTGHFTAGDLLVTNGAIIPSTALLYKVGVNIDLGLDAIHFVGAKENFIRFLNYAATINRESWLTNPDQLSELLANYDIDIWFSVEGTAPSVSAPQFLDGDLLSARYGTIIQTNSNLLPTSVPAGIPSRGVDFGLDAATASRMGALIHFSTELLYDGQVAFSDGDVIEIGNGVAISNADLIACFEPMADFLGLDALSMPELQTQQPADTIQDQHTQTLDPPVAVTRVGTAALANCKEMAFSTEEDFVTQGPEPPDGNPIISDGDLLGLGCRICARNNDLLNNFDISADLGLDAADVIDIDSYIVAFSTELDSTNQGQFTAGDLLTTNGVIIPVATLLYQFNVSADLGLDGIHFVGDKNNIIGFLSDATTIARDSWLTNPDLLLQMLATYDIDIWFSVEGTAPTPSAPQFLDGDILSARYGTIVKHNADILPATVPAGIPYRGVDFGVDAIAANHNGDLLRFSTEILYNKDPGFAFTDGDVLQIDGTVVMDNSSLIACFEPRAGFLGLDALSLAAENFSDLGDAPDSSNTFDTQMQAYPGVVANYPTVFTAGSPPHGPMHQSSLTMACLGPAASHESEADSGIDQDFTNNIIPASDKPDLDGYDDGLLNLPLNLPPCHWTTFDYTVNVFNPDIHYYVNAWLDWNRDGDWDDDINCPQGIAHEWAVQNQLLFSLSVGLNQVTSSAFLSWHPPADQGPEEIWMRITLSEQPWIPPVGPPVSGFAGSGPSSGYEIGETEDYLFVPDKSCRRCADLNCDGFVNFLDVAILADQWLNTGCP